MIEQTAEITIDEAIALLQDLPQIRPSDYSPIDVQSAVAQLTRGMQLLARLTEICERSITNGGDKQKAQILAAQIVDRQEQVLDILCRLQPTVN